MEKKYITSTAKVIINLWNIGLFAVVWCLFYNDYTFDSYKVPGAVMSCLIYCIIYMFLCKIYKAFRIASMRIWESVLTHIICFGIADAIMYIECCLIYNQIVSLIPGIIAVCMQLAGTTCFVTGFKRYIVHHVPPQNTTIIYGNRVSEVEIQRFTKELLKKYYHLFDINKVISENNVVECMDETVEEAATILLYEVSHSTRKKMMNLTLESKKNLYFTPTIEDITLQGCSEKHLLDTPLLKYGYVYENPLEYKGKRLFDIVMSLVLLVLTSPFMLLSALAIKVEDRGPVFYKQVRCTKDGKKFEIIKFRSMIVDAEKDGVVPCKSGDSRITKVGNVLRKIRFDELPQLINILRGDMSFVGPRPERVEHVELYMKELPEFAYRMRVKGGLTGYAQIFGKYNTSAYDKLRLDLMYIENQSFLLDLKLLMLTLKIIFIPESTEGFKEENSERIRLQGKK